MMFGYPPTLALFSSETGFTGHIRCRWTSTLVFIILWLFWYSCVLISISAIKWLDLIFTSLTFIFIFYRQLILILSVPLSFYFCLILLIFRFPSWVARIPPSVYRKTPSSSSISWVFRPPNPGFPWSAFPDRESCYPCCPIPSADPPASCAPCCSVAQYSSAWCWRWICFWSFWWGCTDRCESVSSRLTYYKL